MIQFSTRTAAALLAALATIALCAAPQPASAAKKEAAAEEAPKPSFSKGFVKAAKSVQKDVDAKKWPEALAGIATLEALPDLNDDDWKVILNWKLLAQQGTGDTEGLMGTLETWLAKGYATPEQTVLFHQNLAAHYSKKNDAEKTLLHYKAFIDASPDPEPDEIAVLGRIYMQRGDNEQAVAWLNKAAAAAEAKGQQPEELWFQLMDRSFVEMKDPTRRLANLEELAKRFPKREYYSRVLALYSQGTGDDRILMLNAYRLALVDVGLSTVGEYLGYADTALVLGSPGEALRALEKGMAAGVVPSAGTNQQTLQEARNAVARDRKDLPRDAEAAAKNPKGEVDVKVGLGFYSLGEWAKAAESVDSGLKKGGVKRADDAHLLRGAALVELGRYDEAKQAFAAAAAAAGTNDYMRRVAGLWTAYAVRKARGAGAGAG